jgi:hypothetical protein
MVQLLEFVLTKVNDVAKVFGTTTNVGGTTVGKDSTTATPYKTVTADTFNDIVTLTALATIAYYTIQIVIHACSLFY